jgi:tetratricopeptide (TPR) repeat protein
VQIDPGHAETHVFRGTILNDLGRHDEALASCDRAIAQMPGSAAAHDQKAYALAKLDRMEESLESFNTAMAITEGQGPALTGRAWLHAICERWDLARRDYEEAHRLDPANEDAWKGLAYLPVGFLTAERACDILERLGEGPEGPALPARLFLKANLLMHLRRYQESFHCLRRANQLRLSELAQSERWRKKFAEAHQDAERWNPIPSTAHRLGSGTGLLVILGPSRSGKTTLERLFWSDTAFLHGLEGGGASAALGSLREIAGVEGASGWPGHSDVSQRVVAALFPSRADEMLAGGHKVVTNTNPFLLPAAQLIHDLHPQSFFIFLERDQVDNAAEIFAADYKDRYPFAYSPRDTLYYVDAYQKVSAVLCRKMGNRAVRISYEELLASPDRVVSEVHAMLGMQRPQNTPPTDEARDPRSVYREMFMALCAEQGIDIESYSSAPSHSA